MSKMYEKLQKCVSVIRGKTDFVPEVALILGSGLGEYAKNMDVKAEIPYSEIEGFPVSTVAGHDGRFLFGYVGKVPMVIMKGRGGVPGLRSRQLPMQRPMTRTVFWEHRLRMMEY